MTISSFGEVGHQPIRKLDEYTPAELDTLLKQGDRLGEKAKQIIVEQLGKLLIKDPHYQISHIENFNNLQNVRTLNVNFAELSELTPYIYFLENLVSISLIGNNLKDLPDELSHLEHLQYINVGHNKMTKFPEVIIKIKNLKEVHLRHNPLPLRKIPPFIDELSTKVEIITNRG